MNEMPSFLLLLEPVREHLSDIREQHIGNKSTFSELHHLAGRITSQKMSFVCLIPHYFTAARYLEPLSSAPMCLKFRHLNLLSILSY